MGVSRRVWEDKGSEVGMGVSRRVWEDKGSEVAELPDMC